MTSLLLPVPVVDQSSLPTPSNIDRSTALNRAVAIGSRDWRPKIDRPKIQIVRFGRKRSTRELKLKSLRAFWSISIRPPRPSLTSSVTPSVKRFGTALPQG
jgi:hypothetical protein